MTGSEVVRLANRIAAFFAAYPEEEAVAGIAGHFADFWDPRMRLALARHVEVGGEGLHPLALRAARRLAETA